MSSVHRRPGRVLAAAALVLPLAGVGVAAATTSASAAPASPGATRVCSAATPAGYAHCDAYIRNGSTVRALSATATPSGYGPADLQSAYALASASARKGGSATIAVVDAYRSPNAESDLATYRSQYGLPACTTANGCFKQEDQNGGSSLPATNASWALEISLDVDMVSAICPKCHILLMAASSNSFADLGTAENTAAATPGVVAVSNSFGGSESTGEVSADSQYFNHPGVATTVSSGDGGYGVEYPAASPNVTAVGGTSLTHVASGKRAWTESVWGSANNADGGAGSGCSAYEAKPSWQHDTGCARRTVADVSAVADPNTGVAVYDSTYYQGLQGWSVVGGTSAAAPIIAGVYGLGGLHGSGTATSRVYAHSSSLYDVTTGANGTCSQTAAYLCSGAKHYDGPTGLGTPKGVSAF